MTAGIGTASAASSNALLAIFWGGLACGVFDISQAFLAWGIQNGVKPVMILHHVASGLIGPARANQGGTATAALGLLLHFVIAFGAATVYYVASRWIPFMTNHAVISGLLFGEAVFLFMNFVVVPLSRHRAAVSVWPHSSPAPSDTRSWWACRLRYQCAAFLRS